MKDLFHKKYNEERAVEAYKSFLRDGNMNDLITALLPLVRAVARRFAMSESNLEVVKADILYDLYKSLLIEERIPTREKKFSSHLATTMRRSALRSVRRMHFQEFDFGYAAMNGPLTGVLPSIEDVEAKILKEEIENLIYLRACRRVRFSGKDRDVCFSIIREMVERSPERDYLLSRVYSIDLRTIRTLREYVSVLVKQSELEVREEHGY